MAGAPYDSTLRLAARNILHTIAVLSAVFALFFLLLWIHSYSYSAIFEWSGGVQPEPVGGGFSFLMVYSQRGGVGFQLRNDYWADRAEHDPARYFGTNGSIFDAPASGYLFLIKADFNRFYFSLWGLSAGHRERLDLTTHHTSTQSVIVVPHLTLVMLLSILPAVVFRRQRAAARNQYRAQNGLCLGCAYDLRHSTLRCPECGREIVPTPPARITGGDHARFADAWLQRTIGLLLSIGTIVAYARLHFLRDHFDEDMWQFFMTRRMPEEVFLTFAGVWGVLIGNLVRSRQMYRLWNLTAIGLLVLAALRILSRADHVNARSAWFFGACCAICIFYTLWASRLSDRQSSWTTSKTNA